MKDFVGIFQTHPKADVGKYLILTAANATMGLTAYVFEMAYS